MSLRDVSDSDKLHIGLLALSMMSAILLGASFYQSVTSPVIRGEEERRMVRQMADDHLHMLATQERILSACRCHPEVVTPEATR